MAAVEFDVRLRRFRAKETGELVSGRAFRWINQAAFQISKDAKRSIRNDPEPARPGRPPHSRRGKMRFSIRYHADRQKKIAVIGPRFSITNDSAKAHEFGGRYKGQQFERRPFMFPALERNRHRLLGGGFSGSVGG